MKTITKGLAAFGIAALMIGFAGQTAARADEYDRYGSRDGQHIRRDEDRLHELQRSREWAKRHHDWRAVRDLDWRIRDLQDHIRNDRRDVRHDAHADYHDYGGRYDRR